MKRTAQPVQAPKSEPSSEPSMDCTCEILYETSLSNVSDSDCDCSDCLEAHLDAFNEFKNEQQITRHTIKQEGNRKDRKVMQSNTKTGNNETKGQLARYRSTDRMSVQERKTSKFRPVVDNQEGNQCNFAEFKEGQGYTNGQLNDFLLITKHRTRKYLQQRKKLEQDQKQSRQNLKFKIKKNLELLKYTTKMMNQDKQQQQPGQQQSQQKQNKPVHKYKWNHQQYIVHPKKNDKEKDHQNQCCRKIKEKKQLETGLKDIIGDFPGKRDQILDQNKRKREQAIQKVKNQLCPHDHCPNHHNRTQQKKIRKIQRFIQKNAKKYEQQKLQEKKRKEQEQKTRLAKLRAIQLKSKQMLGRAKKIDDNVSRTSFKLSIQQFDTFSQLRQDKQRKLKVKEDRLAVKKAMKEGGALQNKIYQDLDEEEESEYQPAQNTIIKRTIKADQRQYREDAEQQLYERIAFDAQIKVPKQIKKKVKPVKNQQPKPSQEMKPEQKKPKNLSKTKQQEQKKRIQAQIDRKKKQILQEYKKRNSNAPSNKQIRKQYQDKLKQKDVGNPRKANKAQVDQKPRDPYRTNYPTRAGKDANQVAIQGDPLLQQYTYHLNKQASKDSRGQNMQVFTQNIHSLKAQKRLKP